MSDDDGRAASDADKIEGIVAQTRADYPGDDATEIEDRLRQRFEQSGIEVPEERLAELVATLAAGGRPAST